MPQSIVNIVLVAVGDGKILHAEQRHWVGMAGQCNSQIPRVNPDRPVSQAAQFKMQLGPLKSWVVWLTACMLTASYSNNACSQQERLEW